MTGDFLVAFSALTLGGVVIEALFLNPVMKTLLFSLNVFILVYIAYGSLATNSKKIEETLEAEENNNSNNNTILKRFGKQYGTGFVLVVTSPWSYLWWASFGTVILFGEAQVLATDPFGRLLIVFLFLSGICSWVILYCISLSLLGKIPNPLIFNLIVKASASLLLFFAVLIGFDAICTFSESIVQNWC